MTRSAMDCPKCGGANCVSITYRARPKRINGGLWRGHECRDCGHRFVSIQRIASIDEIEAAS